MLACNNELVDFSEMIIGLTTLTNPNLDERLEWMFKFYDQKRMGYIEEYELKMSVKAILKIEGGLTSAKIQAIDNFDIKNLK